MPYCIISGQPVYYEMGIFRPERHIFVFLHGLGGSIEQCKNAFTQVPPEMDMVYVDLRGNGKTPLGNPKELSFIRLAQDIYDLCGQMGAKRVIIGGISMGAGVAARFAVEWPAMVEGLILIRPAWLDGPMPNQAAANFAQIADLLENFDPKMAVEKYMAGTFYKEQIRNFPANARSSISCLSPPNTCQNAKKYRILPKDRPLDSMTQLAEIRVPALILGNRGDPLHPYTYAEEYHRAIFGSHLEEIPSKNTDEAGHSFKLNSELRRFTSYIAAGGR